MACTTYILYSPTRDRYYIGSTSKTLESRLEKHNQKHGGYTGRQSDWRVVYQEEYPTYEEAYARERKVKSWKSRKMIERLIQGERKT